MSYDITPGTYRNTNTGVHFDVEVEGDSVHITQGGGETQINKTMDAGNFWFNTLETTGPTYELVEAAGETDTANADLDPSAEYA